MRHTQADLFAQDNDQRNQLSEPRRLAIRSRLEVVLARLEASSSFPWDDPLDAVHEENRFQREAEALGAEGSAFWARFDKEMDRLHEMQSVPDACATGTTP